MTILNVQCPAGCGETLYVDADNRLVCGNQACSRPDAAALVLAEPQGADHLVKFDDTGFTIKHPLIERLDDALLDCMLHHDCAELGGRPDDAVGTYRARISCGNGCCWTFEAVA